MGIIINKSPKVIVQGITGNEGRFHTAAMLRYGTGIVAGVTPGKGGQRVEGLAVYDTVAEAVSKHGADASILFVPAAAVRDAVFEAIDAGVKTLVVITELIPQKDAIEFMSRVAKSGDVVIIGPNTPGIINPGQKVHIGIMPAQVFSPGIIGIASRSGTLTYEVAWHITQAGLGQSTCVGLGGDAITGLDFVELLEMFRSDKETKGVVLIGEVGGSAEEMAAQYISETRYPKPVVAYIAGRLAPPEKRMGHAGAIVSGGEGSASDKLKAFESAGIPAPSTPALLAEELKSRL